MTATARTPNETACSCPVTEGDVACRGGDGSGEGDGGNGGDGGGEGGGGATRMATCRAC
eukprot:CAMPEP_0115843510 /NCGR_PEP_ID=MMETSP0287-20121206/8350_1 /TAXON_ID=412157 /ORGANISM="Chrysochromulina rotalis, Strain UIO044" /LENGTH=58 /DNA_ID=CAMNT_0003297207 /DNA_START=227 /DNA_END=400 /DNA_ORIENTATION=+